MAGTDGGVHITYDRARTWDFVNTVPLAQFYEISFDLQRPYRVCGGLQDNGAGAGPAGLSTSRASRTRTGPGWAAATASTT
jgi:hypothetical protein